MSNTMFGRDVSWLVGHEVRSTMGHVSVTFMSKKLIHISIFNRPLFRPRLPACPLVIFHAHAFFYWHMELLYSTYIFPL